MQAENSLFPLYFFNGASLIFVFNPVVLAIWMGSYSISSSRKKFSISFKEAENFPKEEQPVGRPKRLNDFTRKFLSSYFCMNDRKYLI